jgi:hypothetical protein
MLRSGLADRPGERARRITQRFKQASKAASSTSRWQLKRCAKKRHVTLLSLLARRAICWYNSRISQEMSDNRKRYSASCFGSDGNLFSRGSWHDHWPPRQVTTSVHAYTMTTLRQYATPKAHMCTPFSTEMNL